LDARQAKCVLKKIMVVLLKRIVSGSAYSYYVCVNPPSPV